MSDSERRHDSGFHKLQQAAERGAEGYERRVGGKARAHLLTSSGTLVGGGGLLMALLAYGPSLPEVKSMICPDTTYWTERLDKKVAESKADCDELMTSCEERVKRCYTVVLPQEVAEAREACP